MIGAHTTERYPHYSLRPARCPRMLRPPVCAPRPYVAYNSLTILPAPQTAYTSWAARAITLYMPRTALPYSRALAALSRRSLPLARLSLRCELSLPFPSASPKDCATSGPLNPHDGTFHHHNPLSQRGRPITTCCLALLTRQSASREERRFLSYPSTPPWAGRVAVTRVKPHVARPISCSPLTSPPGRSSSRPSHLLESLDVHPFRPCPYPPRIALTSAFRPYL